MDIEIQLTHEPITEEIQPLTRPAAGAWLEFRGVVRGEEAGQRISALEYEAYPEMARREIRRILEKLAEKFPCLAARVIHRLGVIPVGATAIYVGVASPHRGEALGLLAEFMDRLKQDVPIWKRRALPDRVGRVTPCAPGVSASGGQGTARPALKSLDEALAEIRLRCRPLPAIPVPLQEGLGRVLREAVRAPEDLPRCDRSTRDGYAVPQDDPAESFLVVDTIHAADWKPRSLQPGQAVRVATGAALPCGGLRVVMQEHVERQGDQIRILRREDSANVRSRGEDVRAGRILAAAGIRLNAGALALLAAAGRATPLVSPRPRVCHFTTGDEIVPPGRTPAPGQVRDSNSILIRGLLQNFSCDLQQAHLPENFERAKLEISSRKPEIENADLLLVSGGASVGERDFTRALLEWLGFEIVFNQVNLRPGRPLIFGVCGPRAAFGLPGNPLSHFVCFHLFVAAALAKLGGQEPQSFLRGRLAEKLEDQPCPRETLWPTRVAWRGAAPQLRPLPWASSGDVTCLAQTNALIRVPAGRGSIEAGAEADFLPTTAE
ncbi:MAG: molybdenum cofactor biosynthesis protein MoaE [Verrucomicrobiota bacterium]|nr:molybdenum cofactor biosynthesis protein MoaE [Verrucomicrobiota bacterium]